MLRGLRVVRGPDWKHDNQDGGHDHVGTVVAEQGDNTVKVNWDMGDSSICKAEDGNHELKIFDSASIGVTHPNIACVGCEEVCILGTLWKCSTCQNTNLCSLCYHDDKHDATHTFLRIDFPGTEPRSGKRRNS
ncbi:E3 ubiquitin-protein ligase MIB1-like [Mercenaria mercenaria]|uniref:E3 ubiquitin-protein ligase MIB1-like n=1 Tax=Mercenaria mercenaria TaxID=6596 RepID=UPI00234FA328|nr:E3 ubiquitin-protein ligase MIB1-like [Mercenaria mercenaria]